MTRLTTCTACAKEYSTNLEACINCGEPNPSNSQNSDAKNNSWYHKKAWAIPLLVLFPPAGLYAMFKGQHFPSFVR